MGILDFFPLLLRVPSRCKMIYGGVQGPPIEEWGWAVRQVFSILEANQRVVRDHKKGWRGDPVHGTG